MWEYSVYDPFEYTYMRFRSKVPPRAFLAPQYQHCAVTPLQAVVIPLPMPPHAPMPEYIGTSEEPHGTICSLDQYEVALQIKEQSGPQESEASFVDMLGTAATIFWIFSLLGKASKRV